MKWTGRRVVDPELPGSRREQPHVKIAVAALQDIRKLVADGTVSLATLQAIDRRARNALADMSGIPEEAA